MAAKGEQRFTVGRSYRGYETFTVLAASGEEAINRLEDEGPETAHVSERDRDEYLSIERHVVFDQAGTKLLERSESDERNAFPTHRMAFVLQRRGADLYFQAAHKPAATWHGPYVQLQELADVIGHYLIEDLTEALFKEEY